MDGALLRSQRDGTSMAVGGGVVRLLSKVCLRRHGCMNKGKGGWAGLASGEVVAVVVVQGSRRRRQV